MQALLFGHIFFARRTVTQALVVLGLTDQDWSAFYRLFNEPRIDYEELTSSFFSETLPHVPETDPYVAVVDGVQVPRRSSPARTAPNAFFTWRRYCHGPRKATPEHFP
jgi:hypothetical protein